MSQGRLTLPRTARDVFALGLGETVAYRGLIALAELTGRWEYPMRANGDLERMTFLDKVYWLYKAGRPITKARRGSGLEAFFEAQSRHVWRLPDGLAVERELSLSAVGDLMDHPYLRRSADSLYAGVSELIFGADIPMANLECTILPGASGSLEFTTKSGPPLNYELESFAVVSGAGDRKFAFLATACNHSLDSGVEGVDSTIRVLRERGIAFHGTNAKDEDAARATVLCERDIRVGAIAFTFGLNAHTPPPDRPLIVNRTDLNGEPESMDLGLLERQLQHCRESAVDFVVAHLHWGFEHEFYPTPEQVRVAHHLAEMGVDAIVGHHPHVLQPMECYRTQRDPDRVVPIFYSLGNLTSPFSAPEFCRSGVARIELGKGTTRDGTARTYVKRAGISEIVQTVDSVQRRLRLELAVPIVQEQL